MEVKWSACCRLHLASFQRVAGNVERTAQRMICEVQRSRTRTRLLPVICTAVLCIILILGLWPFHAPPNDVSWLGNRNGLHFGRFSTAFSSSEFRITPIPNPGSGSLEIWL